MEHKNVIVKPTTPKKDETPVQPLNCEIWDGDNSGWTRVTRKKRTKK